MLKDLINLTKPRLAMLNVIAAGFGYALSVDSVSWVLFLEAMIYTTLVICGAGALNCLMEIDLDKKMTRTAIRPLPAGRLDKKSALIFGSILIFCGSIGLLLRVNVLTGIISLSSAIFYLVFYTPMKIKSPYAVFVGAVPGALPPVIGYAAGSGRLDSMALILFVFLFSWQIPHFLAISIYSRKDYENAGVVVYPNITSMRHTLNIMSFFTSLTLISSLMPVFLGRSGNVYGVVSLLLGLGFQMTCTKAYYAIGDVSAENKAARKCFLASIIYLPLLLSSMFIL
jgi:heme o synthase